MLPADVTDCDAGTAEMFYPDGSGHARQFASGLKYPYGIAIGSRGHVAVGGVSNNHISVFAPDGSLMHTGRKCNGPIGVTWFSDRQLLVSVRGIGGILQLITIPGIQQLPSNPY